VVASLLTLLALAKRGSPLAIPAIEPLDENDGEQQDLCGVI
jgi:hypothetical protein